jgi:thioredoxin 1
MAVEVLTGESLEEAVTSETVTIVDFWAEWCGPCKALAPFLESMSEKYDGAVKVAKVNVSEHTGAAKEHGVTSIPCLVVFRDGKEIDRMVGFKGQSGLEELFSKHSGK